MELGYLGMPAGNGPKGQNKTNLEAVFAYVFGQVAQVSGIPSATLAIAVMRGLERF